ncbi:hypothetical protein [Roseivivax sp.]
MSKTIMVVGSAPNAKLVPSDHIYFANFSAIVFAPETLRETGAKTTTVCAASAYFFDQFPDLYTEEPDPDKPRKNTFRSMQDRLDRLKAAPVDETLAFSHKDKYLDGLPAEKSEARLVPPQEVFDSFAAMGLTRDLRWPLPVLKEARASGQKIPRKDMTSFLKEFFWKRPALFYSSGYFRPSSGLTTMAIAMATHGPEARYLISGLTFENRSGYSTGIAADAKVQTTSKHTIIDRLLMEKIRERYAVEFI